ncbi:MAG: HEAT repeat domain-containing protein [Calditrichaceae bacterium]|jgi:HEAT repeat protein
MSLNDKKIDKSEINNIIKENILKLADSDGLEREKARKKLVKIGTPVIDFLSEMETHPKAIARWEAVKALSEIRDPLTAPLLINALEDRSFGVRWLAAEGLTALGKEGLVAVLKALLDYPETIYLRRGAHHVLKRLTENTKEPETDELKKILEDPDATVKVPTIIRQYLDKISKNNRN